MCSAGDLVAKLISNPAVTSDLFLHQLGVASILAGSAVDKSEGSRIQSG